MVQHYTTGSSTGNGYSWGESIDPAKFAQNVAKSGSSGIYIEDCQAIGAQRLSKFEQAALDIGKIVAAKNAEYGNSAIESGDILKKLYGDDIQVDTTNMLLVARILDKLSRISHAKDTKTVMDAMLDICGYGLIGYLNTKESMDLEKLEED